jgi:hypothetical protein
MKEKIVHDFKGYINGVQFNDKTLYYSVEYILSELEETFNVEVPWTLVYSLKNLLDNLYRNLSESRESDVEDDLVNCIYDAETIQQLCFSSVWASYGYFNPVNRAFADWDNTYGKDPIIYDETNSI